MNFKLNATIVGLAILFLTPITSRVIFYKEFRTLPLMILAVFGWVVFLVFVMA
ncbi:hypothetical protein [Moraxella oblonga]|uniref:hypothetical protein n=1 Tax=Moraxella oblonga TaxID=200413 RepID=UPI000AEAEF79|nr:hypothetical protein [Moraxella oblonga]